MNNIHLQNGVKNPKVFDYYRAPYKVPMAYFSKEVSLVTGFADFHAPFFRITENGVELDWEHYANSCEVYQAQMNVVLLAMGILTYERDKNLRIVIHANPSDENVMPNVRGNTTYFHNSRPSDAGEFAKRVDKILAWHPLKPRSENLRILQSFGGNAEVFNCNALATDVIIVGPFDQIPIAV